MRRFRDDGDPSKDVSTMILLLQVLTVGPRLAPQAYGNPHPEPAVTNLVES
jgi:hypothetical protein